MSQTYTMNNTGTIESTCSGTFYDPEGTSGYVDFNGSYTMTFQSGTGTQLQFEFTEFDTREANDYLEIYDGQNTSASLIGTYSQNTSPGTITSTGEYLTFVWTTDNNQDGNNGWTATISCVPVPINDECTGAVNLPCGTTDLAGTNRNAISQTHGTGCTQSDHGVWYSFTGDGVETSISATGDANLDIKMAIASGSCGSLSNVACIDNDVNFGGTESYTFTPANGTDYYVYLSHYSGGSTNMGDITISRSCACVADISLAANQPAAATICAGALKVPIQSFSMAVAAGCDGELTDLDFTTTGTYQQADIIKYQLWYNSSNDLSTATQLSSDLWSSGAAGLKSFSSFTSPVLTAGSTWYFWITADISSSATDNNTIAVNAVAPADITSPHNITGSTNASGIQTIDFVTPPGAISSNSPQCVGTGVTFTQGSCSEGTCYWVSSSTGTETGNSSATYTSASAMGTYDVWVRSFNGNCWSTAVTQSGYVTDIPNITSDPSDTSVETGDSHTFSVTADNTPDNYLWEVSTDGGSNWNPIADGGVYSNSTTSNLQISSATLSMNAYQYRAYAQNTCGTSSASLTATLSVTLCTPGYSDGGSTDNITHVILETLDDVPPANNSPYYFDQTASQNAVPILNPGDSYTADVTFGTETNQYSRLWIDFDQNSVFSTDESFSLATDAGSGGTASISFTVPTDAVTGNTIMRIRGGDDSQIPDNAPCGASSSTYGQALDYSVDIAPPAPMSYLSCTAEQYNTDDVSAGADNQEMICIKIVTSGVTSPLELTDINLRTDGSDSYSSDISNINIWYTGASASFSTSNLFGGVSSPSAPATDMTISGTQNLMCGTNHFWVTYDIPSGATDGNVVDSKLQSIILDGITESPTVYEPAGNRLIIRGCHHTLTLMDESGPWSGSSLTVRVDGTDVLTNVSLTSGTSEDYDFIAETGQAITTVYTAGTNPENNSFLISNPNGAYIGSSGDAVTIPTDISVTADCDAIKEFTMNGDTYQNGETCFIITEDKASQSGSVWSNYKIDLSNDFTLEYDVFLGDDDGGADGIVFALQGNCASSGGDGASLGYGGINNSLGIEFDTYDNASDPAGDHIAIISNGSVSHGVSTELAAYQELADMEDNAWHPVKVIWDASSQTMDVEFDGSSVISYTGDIVTNLFNGDPQVFWGFTGGTGSLHNLQKVCVNSYPQNTTEIADMNICLGCTVDVEVASGANSYSWTPDDGSISDATVFNPTLSPTVTTDYTVTVEDGCGNFLTNKFTVVVGTLPVELLTFNADCIDSGVSLTWKTATERNNDFYILEKSMDHVNFTEIARITGIGNSETLTEYQFLDNEMNDKPVYYRLSQVDTDQSTTVLETRSVHCNNILKPDFRIYPNPSKDKVFIEVDQMPDSECRIVIIDLKGRAVLDLRWNFNENGSMELDLNELLPSTYLLRIITDHYISQERLVKLK